MILVKRLLSVFLLLSFIFFIDQKVNAQLHSLNKDIQFSNGSLFYKNKEIRLGSNSFYIDAQLSDDDVGKYPYIFKSINEAVKHLKDGTEAEPMTLYIAPYVYWIDNPDDPEVRVPKPGSSTPFGLEIKCNWLKFFGLSDNAEDIVLACNRGQTIGAKGNFTMFNIIGDGTSSENITFGNYCNVDLVYPLKPLLNKKKRADAIVQAQLVFCKGDKLVARNTRFISRLNLCPFTGGKRTLFDRCHFESTDDALNGNAVYLNCDFDFYGSKPFWGTSATGAVFLNCDIRSFVRGEQYFVKSGGQVAVVDTRFTSQSLNYIGWKDKVPLQTRNYAYNVSLNGKPITIDARNDVTTVDLKDKPLLNAYRFMYKNEVVYNTYNLLRGSDDWDPMQIKSTVLQAEKDNGQQYTGIPTQLIVHSSMQNIETAKDSAVLTATALEFSGVPSITNDIKWSVDKSSVTLVTIKSSSKEICLLMPVNKGDEQAVAFVGANNNIGLTAATAINVLPQIVAAPDFKTAPSIQKNNDQLQVNYTLNTSLKDCSEITWYRSKDKNANNAIQVAVTRFNDPLNIYKLSAGDIGYYIMAEVKPKHIRSYAGAPKQEFTSTIITNDDVHTSPNYMDVDLRTLSTQNQNNIIPGFFTLDAFAPADTKEFNWQPDTTKNAWYYGSGIDGAAEDSGFIQAVQGARLRYTPVGTKFNNMKLSFTAVPAKTAGQGFGSARAQYLDVFIKFDTKNLTGYALRIERTTKYGDAVDFTLMKYENGIATTISKPVSTTSFRPNCNIVLEISDNIFTVHATNNTQYYSEPGRPELVRDVSLKAEIAPNHFGGFGFQHTGTVGAGATLIKDLKIHWE